MQKAGSCKTILLIECGSLNIVDKIQLASGEDFRVIRTKNLNEFTTQLKSFKETIDVILIDDLFFEPGAPVDFFEVINSFGIPFFIVTSSEYQSAFCKIDNSYCAGYLLKEGSGEYFLLNISNSLKKFKKNYKMDGIFNNYELLKSCFDESGVGLSVVDFGGRWIATNSVFENLVEYSGHELLSMTIHQITHPDDLIKNNNSFDALVAGEQDFYKIRKRYITKNNNTVWVDLSVRSIRDSSGNLIAIIASVVDITENIKLTEKLGLSESRFAGFINSLPNIAIQGYDSQGNIQYWNKASETLYGFSEKEAVGKNFVDLIIPEDINNSVIEKIKNMMASNIPMPCDDLILKKKDGTLFPVQSNYSILDFGEGKKELFCIDIDLTERRKTEEQLKEYADELKTLNTTKDKFLSILAHDLRGPFQGFLGVSECIANDTDSLSSDEIKMLAAELHSSLLKQYELLTDLLSWTRMQTGKIVMNFIDFHVIWEIHGVVDSLLLSAKNKSIRIIIDVQQDLMICADVSMFRMLLRNLLSNSIKFTNEGGLIKITAVGNSPFVEISVEDNGIGIDSENLERLFKVDARFTTEGTANEPGTGLGLILCKEIVDRHNGIINVSSQVDKGSIFSFTMPKVVRT